MRYSGNRAGTHERREKDESQGKIKKDEDGNEAKNGKRGAINGGREQKETKAKARKGQKHG